MIERSVWSIASVALLTAAICTFFFLGPRAKGRDRATETAQTDLDAICDTESGGDDAAGGKAPAKAGSPKAPLNELIGCPLAFAGVHLMKDDPAESRVAYHFCKPVSGKCNQCVVYDGTGPNAKLIGIEYLVTNEVYQSMPAEEKEFWHDHEYEVDAGLLRSLTQTGDDEKKTLAAVRQMWGKVFHTWVDGETYPRGPARLFWSVTGKAPFVLSDKAELPVEMRKAAKK
ncbi:MAG TPA: DUF1264 domain-containing protein [Pirellulales bacterium]